MEDKDDIGGQNIIIHLTETNQDNHNTHDFFESNKNNNLRMTLDDAGGQKKPTSLFKCECGKAYKYRQGLWKHKKMCTNEKCCQISTNKKTFDYIDEKELIMMLIKDNNELKKMMLEQQTLMIENNNKVLELCKNESHTVTHTNSHNKAFNLNFFLNETCKNAMNIMDFAESIQLQLSDLETVGDVGYVQGISNIIVKKPKDLDITERPIHCADKKREVIYIKDENKWEKEGEDRKNLKKVINKVSFKNERLLQKFKEIHPNCNFSESKYSDQYSKLVIEAFGGVGNNNEEKTNKIIKNIVKEVVIDKHFL